jgi:hypothetical protein
MVYTNPLVPPGVVEPLEVLRASPAGYAATIALHLFALVDVDFPFVYIRDLDPWYRWPLSVLNYVYLFLALAGVWVVVRCARDRKSHRRVFAVAAGIFAAGAYVTPFLPVAVEARYGVPLFMLVLPAVTAALLATSGPVRVREWRPLLAPGVVAAMFVGGCAVLSAWVQEQAPLLHERPREARYTPVLSSKMAVDPPTVWAPGETRTYEMVITNVGYFPWTVKGHHRVLLGAHFGSFRTLYTVNSSRDQTFDLAHNQAVGDSQRVTLTVTAPTEPGCYYLFHRPIVEGGPWFGEHNYTPVAVGEVPPEQMVMDRRTRKGPCEPAEVIPSAPYQ